MGAITTVGVDGDDTLWHSENHFELTTARLAQLLAPWVDDAGSAHDRLIETERRNLALLGYGVKAFTLSMVETAIDVSDGAIPASSIREILDWGRELLAHPVELLDGVADTLEVLAGEYDLVLVTKGDLLHQESKIARSGIDSMFGGIEIVSEKDPATYGRVLQRRSVEPADFVMVGNSVRSDVLPVLELGGRAIHVPYTVTWALEHPDPSPDNDPGSGSGSDGPTGPAFPTIGSIRELPGALDLIG